MQPKNTDQYKKVHNHALSQLFSPSLLSKIQTVSGIEDIQNLIQLCKIYPENESWNLIRGLEIAYNHLKSNYRCEYVYKNEIANQLLLKYHNDNSATLLKEVSSNSSIADIVIVNGCTTAYEIKTELDSFDRLANQISSYQNIYDCVNVVTHRGAVKNLKQRLDDCIGIVVLDENGILVKERPAAINSHLFDSKKAGFTMRQAELVSAYEKYVGKLPPMGTALIYMFCYEWYLTLDQEDAYLVFYEALKSRKPSIHQLELINQSNRILKMLFLGKDLSKKYCVSTMNILSTFD